MIPLCGSICMRLVSTTDNRGRYDRSKLRYPSDLTDAIGMVNLVVHHLESETHRVGQAPTSQALRDLVFGVTKLVPATWGRNDLK